MLCLPEKCWMKAERTFKSSSEDNTQMSKAKQFKLRILCVGGAWL